MNFIKKIWNDSVWSKVIATIISPYVLAALISVKGLFDGKGYLSSLEKILTIDCPIWVFPLVVLITILVVLTAIRYKKNHDVEKSVIRHQGPYITFKESPQDQCYCSVCWDDGHKKVQLPHYYDNTFKCPKCNSEGSYDVEKKEPLYSSIYKF